MSPELSDSSAMPEHQHQPEIFEPITLPCGRIVQNRLVKVAMYEHLAPFLGGRPNAYHLCLYSEWAKHEWGIVVTGNVQISENHLTLGRDLVIPTSNLSEQDLESYRDLASSIHGVPRGAQKSASVPNKTLALMQLNHAGRQSSNFIGGRLPFQAPLAPSPVPLGLGSDPSFASTILHSILFQTPKEMTESNIDDVIQSFVRGAIVAHKAGFDGIQLHAAHGYLLSQFLSKKTNVRKDKYSVNNATNVVYCIVKQIRQIVKDPFVVSIKLNAADYIYNESSNTDSMNDAEQLALQHLITIADWGLVDIIEISGGDYEQPDFMATGNNSKPPRQAFFSHFSHQALKILHSRGGPVPLILLTGGLRTPWLLRSALACKHADLLGVGRGSIVCPDFPSVLRQRLQDSHRWDGVPVHPEPRLKLPWMITYASFSWVWNVINKVKLVGAGVTMAWYIVTMRHCAESVASGEKFKPNYNLGGLQSIFWMWVWTIDGIKPMIYLLVSGFVVLSVALSLYK